MRELKRFLLQDLAKNRHVKGEEKRKDVPDPAGLGNSFIRWRSVITLIKAGA